jgi:hypothetical protein
VLERQRPLLDALKTQWIHVGAGKETAVATIIEDESTIAPHMTRRRIASGPLLVPTRMTSAGVGGLALEPLAARVTTHAFLVAMNLEVVGKYRIVVHDRVHDRVRVHGRVRHRGGIGAILEIFGVCRDVPGHLLMPGTGFHRAHNPSGAPEDVKGGATSTLVGQTSGLLL